MSKESATSRERRKRSSSVSDGLAPTAPNSATTRCMAEMLGGADAVDHQAGFGRAQLTRASMCRHRARVHETSIEMTFARRTTELPRRDLHLTRESAREVRSK